MDHAGARTDKLKVTFRPKEVSTRVPAGTTLFHAAAWTGQPIESTCGGRGTCGKCKVRIVDGTDAITPADREHLDDGEIGAGWRLSCQAMVREDMIVEVPRLLTTPKTAMFGVGRQVLLDPNVHKVHLKLTEPELHDQKSDVVRLKDALRAAGFAMSADLEVLRTLPKTLRDAAWDVTAVLCGEDLLAIEPGDTTAACFGVAFDLGTTTIVGTLMNLVNGASLGVASTLNAQAIHGGDVLSRISYTMSKKEGLEELQHLAAFTINGILERLAADSAVPPDRIYEITIAGNLTMMHLLLGIDPEPISVTPFVPAVAHGLHLKAALLGLKIHPAGRAYLFPAIGAYVGGDIVAGLLATALPRGDRLRLFVDVGTNGEIALGSEQRTVATAAPAGPAFEGAEISC
ncbi:MAG: ASKHA domain-containing protein, partial [Candidatus Polarisedimenticolia bacterium]